MKKAPRKVYVVDNGFVASKAFSLSDSAGELKCNKLVIVTNNDKRTIEKDGYKIDVVPISEF